MAAREMLEAGNNSIDAKDEFASGYCNGSLYYYDTNHQLPRPLKSEAISRLMLDNLHDTRASVHWNAGFVCGWLVAMSENNPEYFFTSLPITASAPVVEHIVWHVAPLPIHLKLARGRISFFKEVHHGTAWQR